MVTIFLIFILIITLMILGVPIAYAFGGGGILLLLIFDIQPLWAMNQSLQLISAYTLLAAPLYVLLGTVINHGGMAHRIIDVADAFLGKIKGGAGSAMAA